MQKPKAEDILKMIMLTAYQDVKYNQALIDEWNDPKDIAQRAAVLIKKIHQAYGHAAYLAFNILQENKPKFKHPKKIRDVTAEGIAYCMDCNADL